MKRLKEQGTGKNCIIGLLNARSICNKIPELMDLITDAGLDILCVTETWLKKNDEAIFREIHEFGYDIFSQPRAGRGGGVGFICKIGFPVVHHKVKKFKSFEVSEVVLKDGNDCIRLSLIYRPGVSSKSQIKYEETKVQSFLLEFDCYLDELMNKHGKPLLCGDFNFHLEDAANTDSNKFLELLSCRGYAPVLDAHLTETHREGGVLDAFITSNNVSDRVHLLSINVLPETGTASDHNLVRACVEFDVMDTPSSTQQMMIYRRLWKMDLEKMKDDLNNAIILHKFCECFNVNDSVENYNTILSSILDEHAPKIVKFMMGKQKRTCWWDGTCQEVRRRQRKAERAFKENWLISCSQGVSRSMY